MGKKNLFIFEEEIFMVKNFLWNKKKKGKVLYFLFKKSGKNFKLHLLFW